MRAPECDSSITALEMPEKVFLYYKFNLEALVSLAESLRGQKCSCDTSVAPKSGGLNWVIFIAFEDGIEWVFRSPRNSGHRIVSNESAQKMLISEAAALKFLKKNTSIPIPEVFSFRFEAISFSSCYCQSSLADLPIILLGFLIFL